MRLAGLLVILALLLAGCGGQAATSNEAPPSDGSAAEAPADAPQPSPTETSAKDPAPDSAHNRPIEEIAAEIPEGMPCEEALARLPEPAGSFSGADVVVTGLEVSESEEERITYVWELDQGRALLLTCLDGSVLGASIEGGQ